MKSFNPCMSVCLTKAINNLLYYIVPGLRCCPDRSGVVRSLTSSCVFDDLWGDTRKVRAMKRCIAGISVVLLTAALAAGAPPAGWFDHLQLEVTMTRNATVTGVWVYEPDPVMRQRTYELFIGNVTTGVVTPSRGSGKDALNRGWYHIPFRTPVTLSRGQRYTIQTRYYATFFNAGRPTLLRFREGDLRTFTTYDGVTYYGRF